MQSEGEAYHIACPSAIRQLVEINLLSIPCVHHTNHIPYRQADGHLNQGDETIISLVTITGEG